MFLTFQKSYWIICFIFPIIIISWLNSPFQFNEWIDITSSSDNMRINDFLLIQTDLEHIEYRFHLFEHWKILTDLTIHNVYTFIMHNWLTAVEILNDSNRQRIQTDIRYRFLWDVVRLQTRCWLLFPAWHS